MSIRNGKASGSGSRSDKGKGGKGGKSKSKKGGNGKEKDEKPVSKFEVECRYCQKKGHKKAECRKMEADLVAGKCDKHGKPTGVNSLTARDATQPSPQASYAPSLASTTPMQQMVPVHFPNPIGSQHSETCFINMIVPAQKTLLVASLDGAQYALLGSRSGLTSCAISNADGLRHVANLTNLIISSESLTSSNIEVRACKERKQHDHGSSKYTNNRGSAQVREGSLVETATRQQGSAQ